MNPAQDISLSAIKNPNVHFGDRLIVAVKAKGNPVCVGLDPRLNQIPQHLKEEAIKKFNDGFEGAANAFLEFNKGIIMGAFSLSSVLCRPWISEMVDRIGRERKHP